MVLLTRVHLLLFPPLCRLCGAMMEPLMASRLKGREKPAPGFPHLCGACFGSLPFAGEGAALIPPPGVDRLWAVLHYAPPVSQWIRRFKYGGQDSLAPMLGYLMSFGSLPGFDPTPGMIVAPVPLHPRRVRERGFNQSHLLARQWLRRLAPLWPLVPIRPPVLRPNLLSRGRFTRPQVELDASSRETNVAGAFTLGRRFTRKPGSLEGATVLLVDDVATTGATLSDCARVLRKAGAARVEALVLARPGLELSREDAA